METQYVNGFAYNTMRPAPEDEIPERFARAEEVWERKVWREQLREWDETSKPAAIRTHRELQAVDPDALSDDELAAYLDALPRPPRADDLPAHAVHRVGDGAGRRPARAPRGWTGVAPADALAMMRGAAPVSAGASERARTAHRRDHADADARALLDSDGDPGKVLAELRAFDGEVGAAMSDYLDLVGCRLLDGFDISGRYALELPDALAARDPLVRRRRRQRRPPTSTRASPASARRCPTSTAPSSTSCSARRA